MVNYAVSVQSGYETMMFLFCFFFRVSLVISQPRNNTIFAEIMMDGFEIGSPHIQFPNGVGRFNKCIPLTSFEVGGIC